MNLDFSFGRQVFEVDVRETIVIIWIYKPNFDIRTFVDFTCLEVYLISFQ